MGDLGMLLLSLVFPIQHLLLMICGGNWRREEIVRIGMLVEVVGDRLPCL
jgi:hypothetical protein